MSLRIETGNRRSPRRRIYKITSLGLIIRRAIETEFLKGSLLVEAKDSISLAFQTFSNTAE
jgi:hypothetical protein